MRLATARTPAGTRAVVQDLGATRLLELPTVSAALTAGVLTNAPRLRGTPVSDLDALDLAPAVTGPVKIVCIGHNFRTHILEMGHGLPQHPNVFSKFPEALVGACDDIQLDGAAATWDWEAELAVIIGTPVRRATREAAGRASRVTRSPTTCRLATGSDAPPSGWWARPLRPPLHWAPGSSQPTRPIRPVAWPSPALSTGSRSSGPRRPIFCSTPQTSWPTSLRWSHCSQVT